MARRRVGYLLALVGAVGFFLCFNDYFSFYVLALALVLPLFSLCVSLPGIVGAAVTFSASARQIRRGESFALRLALQSRFSFPVARFSARIRCHNLLTGETTRVARKGAGGNVTLTAQVDEAHCGLVRCQVESVKVWDLLGIFSFSLPRPAPVEVLSLPLDLPPVEEPTLLGQGEEEVAMVPRPGGGPGEDYDLRPYRKGDPLRNVHWKLSSKLDELVVREALEPLKIQAILTYDHMGPPPRLDALFDRLDALVRGLVGRERTVSLRWLHPESGTLMSQSVATLHDLRAFEYTAFSLPAPSVGHPRPLGPLSGDGPHTLIRQLHLTAEVTPAGGDGP